MPIYIYSLVDPRTNEIRYIGKTDKLILRLNKHISVARCGIKTYVCNWIRQLLSLDLMPIIEVIEEVSIENWEERETYWISYGKQQGWKLTNHTGGGEGQPGHFPSEETRRKIGLAHKGKQLSEETKKKISEALKGNKKWLGKQHTKESKKKISESAKGNLKWLGKKHTKETKEKISKANQGEKSPGAKLTEDQVMRLRELYSSGKMRGKRLADEFGINRSNAYRIATGQCWKHLA